MKARNSISAIERYQFMNWVDGNRELIASKTDDQVVTAAEGDLGFAVTIAQLKNARDAFGIKKRLKKRRVNADQVDAIEERLGRVEAFLDLRFKSWREDHEAA